MQNPNLNDDHAITDKAGLDVPEAPVRVKRYLVDVREIIGRDPPRLGGQELLQKADRSQLWIRSSNFPLQDPHELVVGSHDPIVEKHGPKWSLRESKERISQTVEAMLDPFSVHTAVRQEGRTVGFHLEYTNATAHLTRLMSEQLLSAHPAGVLFEQFRRVVETGEPERVELDLREDGREIGGLQWAFDIEVTKVGGALVAAWRDVTKRRLAEQEKAVLVRELEAKNAELERFVYTVSHDLKSPLITIRGFMGMMRQDIKEGHLEQVEGDMDRVLAAAERMQLMLEELLRLSRIGLIANASEEVPLRAVVGEALEMIEGRLTAGNVRVEVGQGLPTIWGDRDRLREMFQNLLDNAAKYMGAQATPAITVTAESRDPEIVISVRDNGIGIDPRHLEKIFGLFDQLDPDSDGHGIGLALVKRIVEVHNGRIWAESEGVGRGSAFCFTLPGCVRQRKAHMDVA